MQDGKSNLLLGLAFLLGAVAAALLFALSGSGGARIGLAVGVGLFGLGLGIGALYVGLAAARRRPAERAAAHRTGVAPPASSEALPTVTDYYRNAPDGEPLRRTTSPGRRLPDPCWLPENDATGTEDDTDRPADA